MYRLECCELDDQWKEIGEFVSRLDAMDHYAFCLRFDAKSELDNVKYRLIYEMVEEL